MDTQFRTRMTHGQKGSGLIRLLATMLVMALALSLMGAAAPRAASPFVGIWRAVDNVDGSLMRVTIVGPARGPFAITWTESYFSFCEGRAGLGTGIGRLDPADPNVLRAHMRLRCLRTGDKVEWDQEWQYRPAYDVLASQEDAYGVDTIWTRLGKPLVPRMDLRVNYSHDWVESFYEAGHGVAVKVTEPDGITVKATIEVQTESKDYWSGGEGFQTLDGVWSEPAPDIIPGDWVFAQVDNGQTAKVQIGGIEGTIDLNGDAITGTIAANWITSEVNVDCMPWGAPGPAEMKSDSVFPNGADVYECGWPGEWDIQPGQDVGVAYIGPDGHWVANAFFARNPRIIASAGGDFFWTTDFNQGPLTVSIVASQEEGASLLWARTLEADESGFAFAGFDVHGLNLIPGNYLVISDGATEKGVVLEPITMEIFDTVQEIMAGTAPPNRDVWVAAGPQEWQTGMTVQSDPATGEWMADFKTLQPQFNITEDMRSWSYAQLFDEDGDINEGDPPPPLNPHFTVFPEWEAMELWEWPIDALIHLSIDDPATGGSPDFENDYTVPAADWNKWESFLWIDDLGEYDVKSGDLVTITGEGFTVTHTVRAFTVGALDLAENIVSGTAGSDEERVYVWPHEFGGWPAGTHADPVDGNWTADLDDLEYDLVQSTTGRAEIVDKIGNTTGIDWAVPRIAVYPEGEFVIGWDWRPHGADVHLAIDDPTNGEGIDFRQDAKVEPTPFNPDFWWVKFDFAGKYVVKPGDIVLVTDGTTTREHEVLPLTVNAVDGDADTVTGTSAPEAWVYVHPWDASFDPIQADGDGNWLMNFTDLYDLVPGETNGVTEVFEDDSDSTAMDWYVREAPTRIWVGAFDYVLPETWQAGEHSYRIAWEYTYPSPGAGGQGAQTSFTVSTDAQPYLGFVLLRGGRLIAGDGAACHRIEPADPDDPESHPAIQPGQLTRFLFGWATDYLMTYDEARKHFGSFKVWGYWDEGGGPPGSAQLELDPMSPTDESWPSYECSFTLSPPE